MEETEGLGVLSQLETEIKELEQERNNAIKVNKRLKFYRSLGYTWCVSKRVAPFALTAGIMVGIFTFGDSTPFYRNNVKHYLYTRSEIDSLNNKKYEEQYDSFDNSNETISLVEKWKKTYGDMYTRKITTYSIDKVDADTVTKIVEGKEINSLEEVFGSPIGIKTETQNGLKEDELSTPDYLQAVIYKKDEEEYIVVKESISDVFGDSIAWLIATLFVEMIPAVIVDRKPPLSIEFCDIREKYGVRDVELLDRKLEIRRENYSRVRGV